MSHSSPNFGGLMRSFSFLWTSQCHSFTESCFRSAINLSSDCCQVVAVDPVDKLHEGHLVLLQTCCTACWWTCQSHCASSATLGGEECRNSVMWNSNSHGHPVVHHLDRAHLQQVQEEEASIEQKRWNWLILKWLLNCSKLFLWALSRLFQNL